MTVTARDTWRTDAAVAGALFLLAAAVNLISVYAASRSLVLMGEEMSVSIRDPLFSIEQRTQASIWSTNFGAPAFYWLASHLDPSYSLFSARRWKALAMALLPPLVYLVARRRLGCAGRSAVFGGLVATVLPGIALFGWVATENGLETVVGAAGLYLATSPRRWWWAAPVLGGLAVTTYTSGIAWAVVIVAVCGWRGVRDRRLVPVAVAVAVGVGVVLFPRAWWTGGPQRLVAGGGTVDGSVVANLGNLVRQVGVSGESYYFFGTQPALGSAVLAAVAIVAAFVAGSRRATWPWLAVAIVAVLLWLPAGNEPGVRRAIALSVVAALALTVAGDVVARMVPRGLPRAVALTVAALAVVVPLAITQATWQQSYASGSQALVADFPIDPGPMPPTFARWDAQLRAGTLTARDMAARDDGLRTLAVVWMLADRQGRGTDGLPTPSQIVADTVDPATLPPGERTPTK